jgi:predicted DNA-binding transcriptional regulator YafY
MADGTTAAIRLDRLFHVLPAASAEEGASLTELASALETTPSRIVEDLTEVGARGYYHPGGWPDDLQIFIDGERVRVFNAGGFGRPVQVGPLETVALALGLRGTTAAAHVKDPEDRRKLLSRVEEHLAAGEPRSEAADTFEVHDVEADEGWIRQEILAAARDRHTCAIVYAKPGADDPRVRVIHPYTLVYSQGAWYTVAFCTRRGEVRVFRVDRITEACRTDQAFAIPADFRPEDFLEAGRVYHTPSGDRVRVRYSPRVARWIRERADFEGWTLDEEPGGSVVMEHHVADPLWVVSHALEYGAEAEVLEPEEYRALVREVVSGMLKD